jgi:hypothetical protein
MMDNRSNTSDHQRANAPTRRAKTLTGHRVRLRQRRYSVIVGAAILLTFSASICVAMALGFVPAIFSRNSVKPASASAGSQGSTATIILEPTASRCKQMVFDNDTGRIAEPKTPCENGVILDSNGLPVATGTAGRLDAISRSFLKR